MSAPGVPQAVARFQHTERGERRWNVRLLSAKCHELKNEPHGAGKSRDWRCGDVEAWPNIKRLVGAAPDVGAAKGAGALDGDQSAALFELIEETGLYRFHGTVKQDDIEWAFGGRPHG